MVSKYDKWAAVLVILHINRSATEIADFLKLYTSFMYWVKSSFDKFAAAGNLAAAILHCKKTYTRVWFNKDSRICGLTASDYVWRIQDSP